MSGSLYERIIHLLPHVQKPARYIGNEINMVRKNPNSVDLRMVLSYPDLYEIGMSNVGVKILYHCVNSVPNFSCERVFSPWPDFEKLLREHNIPLFSLETFTPLNLFDVIGFSIGYELLCTNILAILELGGIPLFSRERNGGDPLVIAGGPAVYNPEPMADFIDVFLIGDGERSLVELLHRFLSVKKLPRERVLQTLNEFDFTYVPSLYETSLRGGYCFTNVNKKVRRRVEPDLNELPFPEKPLVPLIKVVQDRIAVEVSRGCTNGCRFCQAGFTYRPVRERSASCIIGIIRESLRNSGYDEVTLLSLSIADYSGLRELVGLIHDEVTGEHVSISLPSLRVNSTSIDVLKLIGDVRKSGLTFAIESADEAVRFRLNKPVDFRQLEQIMAQVVSQGWMLVKLYFMIGLPGASDENEAIAAFISQLQSLFPMLKINLNVSVFVPKPHTPFEGEEQLGLEESQNIIIGLKRRFHRSKIRIKFQDPRMSSIEGILSRGDRRIGKLIYDVYSLGERFSSWEEVFRYDLWKMGMEHTGIKEGRYLRYDASTQGFPWQFISCGITRQFIRSEAEKASKGETTENCLYGSCSNCGVCNDMIKNRTYSITHTSGLFRHEEAWREKKNYKVLFRFRKQGVFCFLSHLDLLATFVKMGKRAGLPYRYSEGFNPKPRLIIPFALPLGISSDCELGEVILYSPLDEEEFVVRYNELLPEGLGIVAASVSEGWKSIASMEYCHDYSVSSHGGFKDELVHFLKLSGAVEKKEVDTEPLSFYKKGEDHLFLRLGGEKSIKGLLRSSGRDFSDFRIRRTGIWLKSQGKVMPFL